MPRRYNHAGGSDEYPPERIDQILRERNADGGVPMEIALRILDDMAAIWTKVRTWSCVEMDRYGMHAQCRQPVHDVDAIDARRARRRAA